MGHNGEDSGGTDRSLHIEEGRCWADVSELPGCFAAGDTLGELF